MDASGMRPKRQTGGKMPWGAIFGLAFIIFYVFFTIAAIAKFPGPVSPLDMYLSTLGNPDISPNGAIYYMLGVVSGGLAEILFFIAIYAHYKRHGQRWTLIVGLVAGVINGIAIVMSGFNPERVVEAVNFMEVTVSEHETWSYIIFFSFIPLLLAFSLAFWRMRPASKWVALYGFPVCAINILFLVAALSDSPYAIMEWVTVASYLVWVLFVSLDLLKRSRADSAV